MSGSRNLASRRGGVSWLLHRLEYGEPKERHVSSVVAGLDRHIFEHPNDLVAKSARLRLNENFPLAEERPGRLGFFLGMRGHERR